MSEQTQRYRDGAGYDHPHYEWQPLPGRAPLEWPNGARLAVTAFLRVEYLELDPPADAVGDPRFGGALGSYFPDFQNYSRREFGNRVGIFRVLDILERHGIRATVCMNAMAAQRYPYLLQRCLRAGHELAAGGLSASRMITSKMDESAERAYIAQTLDILESVSGERPRGWAGQDQSQSERTPQLLAEAGITHLMDFPNDDQPYRLNTTPGLVSIPYQSEWDDAQLFAVRKVDAWRYPELFGSAFQTLCEEGGRMFGFGIHPWIFGQAHRIRYLDEALKQIAGHDQAWFTSAGEIAQWVSGKA
ncbi:MAG: polysaccharide deacetylase family protein [Gammaproteobacteria bacterium]|nr:polysaccharide deacetylase family protein [Gammaproteobacteria bacterium]